MASHPTLRRVRHFAYGTKTFTYHQILTFNGISTLRDMFYLRLYYIFHHSRCEEGMTTTRP